MIISVRVLWKNGKVGRYQWDGNSMLNRALVFARNGHAVEIISVRN